ncbi:MAG: phosphatase PAP2 family protein [Gemmatimonadaceae bacterium]
MTNLIYRADAAVAAALQSTTLQQNELLHAVGRAFNWWGGSGVIYFAAALWLGGRALKQARASVLGLRGAEAIAVASAISGIVKGFAGRARPFVTPGEPWHWNFLHGWTDARYFSMPSGHTTATIAFAAAISVASARCPRPARVMMILGIFTSVFLVAFARTYTNQHWFSDVIAGAVLGAATGTLIARWHERHPFTAFDRFMAGVADGTT